VTMSVTVHTFGPSIFFLAESFSVYPSCSTPIEMTLFRNSPSMLRMLSTKDLSAVAVTDLAFH
jgi:hypothetical protein